MKILLLLLALVLLIPAAHALSCQVPEAPLIVGKRPAALCTTASSVNNECYTFLSNPDNSSERWGALPTRTDVTGVGSIDYYQADNFIVAVEFSRDRLIHEQNITGNVVCGTENASFNFTPRFLDYEEVGEAYVFSIQNVSWLIVGLILAFIVIALLFGIVRLAKN